MANLNLDDDFVPFLVSSFFPKWNGRKHANPGLNAK